jgi:hypothetical protein
VGAALFAYAAAVQYNDPDVLRWLLLYAAASLLCLEAVFRWPPAWVPAAVAIVAIVWAGTLAPHVVSQRALTFDEEERELGGLLIVAVSMAVLAWAARRGESPPGSG